MHSESLSRRAVLGLGAATGALVLSGCRLNNPFSDATTAARKALPELAPDVAVAVRAVVEIGAVADLAASTGRHHPQLAGLSQALGAMHTAHLGALTDAVPDRVRLPKRAPAVPVSGRPAVARRQLLAREHDLHDRLSTLALSAESGAFARLLGSCAASVSQHLAVAR